MKNSVKKGALVLCSAAVMTTSCQKQADLVPASAADPKASYTYDPTDEKGIIKLASSDLFKRVYKPQGNQGKDNGEVSITIWMGKNYDNVASAFISGEPTKGIHCTSNNDVICAIIAILVKPNNPHIIKGQEESGEGYKILVQEEAPVMLELSPEELHNLDDLVQYVDI